jgi:hypothetical protein
MKEIELNWWKDGSALASQIPILLWKLNFPPMARAILAMCLFFEKGEVWGLWHSLCYGSKFILRGCSDTPFQLLCGTSVYDWSVILYIFYIEVLLSNINYTIVVKSQWKTHIRSKITRTILSFCIIFNTVNVT